VQHASTPITQRSKGTCFVISSLRAGGAERSIARLAAHRATRERTVLITLDATDNDFYSLHPSIERIALGMLGRDAGGFARGILPLRRLLLLRRAIARTKCATVVSFVDRTNVVVLLASFGLGLSVVVSERVNPQFSPLGLMWDAARRITYRWATAVVVQSEPVARWAKRFVPADRITTIRNGVGMNVAPSSSRSDTIVAAGRFVRQKGFDVLIEAFGKAAATHGGWKLVLLGDGPERASLLILAERLTIGDRLVLPGIVRNVEDYLAKASIFVLSSRFEGFPNVLLEAMAAGCAVISTDCPSGPSEIIRNGIDGVLVPVNDVESLSFALSRLMNEPELRTRLGKLACEVSARFSLEAEFEAWDRVLDSVAA
jgi:GalNAc-alpha-(1->4)-GalNAc-alpha-(1->3)-diNAcBac-PP-undecaprenol alpha-1,4-N-acetyl-D-galactosaminyltransferase